MTQENLEALKYMVNDRSFTGLSELINDRIEKINKRLIQISTNAVFEEVSQEVKQEAWDLRGQIKGLRSALSMISEEHVESLLKARRENGNTEQDN